MISLTKS